MASASWNNVGGKMAYEWTAYMIISIETSKTEQTCFNMIIFRIICSNKREGRCNWELKFNIGFAIAFLSNAQAKFNFKFVVSKCWNCFWQCMGKALMMMMISASFAEFVYLKPSSLSKSLFNFRYSTQWIQIRWFRLVANKWHTKKSMHLIL